MKPSPIILTGCVCALMPTADVAQDKSDGSQDSTEPGKVLTLPRLPPAPPVQPGPTPALTRNGAVPVPRGRPQEWVTDDDYPAEALRDAQQGVVAFRLEIGTEGQVFGCSITSSSGWPVLDAQTCALLRERANFAPATDSSKTPIAGTFSSRIRWRIPGRLMSTRGSWAVETSFVLDEAGAVSACRVDRFGPVPEGMGICDNPPPMPPKVIAAMRGDAKGPVTIISAMTSRFDGEPPPKDFAEPTGEVVVRRDTSVGIDGDGSIRTCSVIAQSSDDVLSNAPCVPPWDYVSDGRAGNAKRRATVRLIVVRTPVASDTE